MAEEDKTNTIFQQSFNSINNSNGSALPSYRDGLLQENRDTLVDQLVSNYDKPNFTGNKTFYAVVLKQYNRTSEPVAGTTLEGLTNKGIINSDNILQVKAVIPDLHDSVIPLPTDLSPSIIDSAGEFQKYLKLAPTFYSAGDLNGSVSTGGIVEVQIDPDYSEGKIIKIVRSDSVIDAALKSAKKAFDDAQEILNNSSTEDSAGDGKQIDRISESDGKCGNGNSYPFQDCKKQALEASNQIVTLHPIFWDNLNELFKTIKNKTGVEILVGESIRSKETQLNYRKEYCPEWKNCGVSEEQLKIIPYSQLVAKCRCSNKTSVGAVEGRYASNHLKGLAVDLKMRSYCPAKGVNLEAYLKCRQTNEIFNLMNTYADPSKIKNLVSEPWHWSYNGG
jgi:hypothetical protein